MKTKMVHYTLDTLPEPTAEDAERLKKLIAMPDGQIDTSDIPPLTKEQMKRAVRGYVNGVFVHPGSRKRSAA
jgi:hypothetical protein